MRIVVNRLVTHGVLVAALAIMPTLHVLCDTSCVPIDGPTTENTVPSDGVPECHENHEGHDDASGPDSAPPSDGCTHGEESTSSSFSASLTWVGGGGATAPAAPATTAVASLNGASAIYPGARFVPSTGQLLGLFLTPLRI